MRHYSEQPDLPLRAFTRALGKNRPATLEGGGGKGGGDAPQAPDPYTVAGATTQTNQQTAAYNKALNLNNYTNAFGSQQSSISGYDASGAPIYQTNVSASPELQSQLNSLLGQTARSDSINQSAIGGLYGLNSQSAALQSYLNPAAAQQAQQQGQNAAYASQTQYLDPRFSQQQTSLESQLANQGLTPGSQAYDNAYKNFSLSKNQAYSDAANQAITTGSQIGTQNWQNQLAGLSAQSGLLGQQAGLIGQTVGVGQTPYTNLGQIANLIPGYSGTAQSAASPANIAQAFQNQYQGQLNAYNASTGSSNSMQSGLFGLGSSAISAFSMSDRRLKRDIRRIGVWTNGLPVYSYRYQWEKGAARHVGFMADEVRQLRPDSVAKHVSGFDMVNYATAVI